jgi:hypothetical protein
MAKIKTTDTKQDKSIEKNKSRLSDTRRQMTALREDSRKNKSRSSDTRKQLGALRGSTKNIVGKLNKQLAMLSTKMNWVLERDPSVIPSSRLYQCVINLNENTYSYNSLGPAGGLSVGGRRWLDKGGAVDNDGNLMLPDTIDERVVIGLNQWNMLFVDLTSSSIPTGAFVTEIALSGDINPYPGTSEPDVHISYQYRKFPSGTWTTVHTDYDAAEFVKVPGELYSVAKDSINRDDLHPDYLPHYNKGFLRGSYQMRVKLAFQHFSDLTPLKNSLYALKITYKIEE